MRKRLSTLSGPKPEKCLSFVKEKYIWSMTLVKAWSERLYSRSGGATEIGIETTAMEFCS